jgi:hypothetical protein
MGEQTAMQLARPLPLYATARAYCEARGIKPEHVESVRVEMCVKELNARLNPWREKLVKLHPAMYSPDPHAALPESYLKLQEQVRLLAEHYAAELGLPPAPQGVPE